MRRHHAIAIASFVAIAAASFVSRTAGAQNAAPALKWGAAPPVFEPGAQMAVLQGDPSKAGEEFTVRLRLPGPLRARDPGLRRGHAGAGAVRRRGDGVHPCRGARRGREPLVSEPVGPNGANGGHPARDGAEPPVLEVSNLVKVFPVRRAKGLRVTKRLVQAVSDVSFTIGKRETLGLVGESGSGKSTLGRCVLQLIDPSAGSVKYKGRELVGLARDQMRPSCRRAGGSATSRRSASRRRRRAPSPSTPDTASTSNGRSRRSTTWACWPRRSTCPAAR